MRGCAFWGESIVRKHKGKGKELEFSCTYHLSIFILSEHELTSISADTITIHWISKLKANRGQISEVNEGGRLVSGNREWWRLC